MNDTQGEEPIRIFVYFHENATVGLCTFYFFSDRRKCQIGADLAFYQVIK